jgi:hypothetical protein
MRFPCTIFLPCPVVQETHTLLTLQHVLLRAQQEQHKNGITKHNTCHVIQRTDTRYAFESGRTHCCQRYELSAADVRSAKQEPSLTLATCMTQQPGLCNTQPKRQDA